MCRVARSGRGGISKGEITILIVLTLSQFEANSFSSGMSYGTVLLCEKLFHRSLQLLPAVRHHTINNSQPPDMVLTRSSRYRSKSSPKSSSSRPMPSSSLPRASKPSKPKPPTSQSTSSLFSSPILIHAFLSFLLRLFIIFLVDYLETSSENDPSTFKYTDLDYHVFLDSTTFLRNGQNPFNRHTYRYTPLISYLLLSHPSPLFGKILFSLFDILSGLLLSSLISNPWITIFTWFWNPITINICTRGSAESFIVLFPVILTLYIILKNSANREMICVAGLVHGLSVHTKIYPVIYIPGYMIYLSGQTFSGIKRLLRNPFLQLSYRILINPLIFLLSSIISFCILTYISYYLTGFIYIQEGLLYHFGRLDHRHNYSPFWYLIYLLRDSSGDDLFLSFISKLFFIPTAGIIVYISLKISSKDLPFSLFLSTYIFVTLNKVITGQYFTWYISLLPLTFQSINWKNMKLSLLILGFSILGWLGYGYKLEMKGESVHFQLFLMSIINFGANIGVFYSICKNYKPTKKNTRL